MEEELSETKSTLAWSWVIEALAKSPLVNTSILYELVSKAPPLLGISGQEAREATALRCLERLYNSPNTVNENAAVSDLSEYKFDFSESCEAALQRITSGSKGSSDDRNSDIELFIKHKKASLSKSTLEMLNDTILEGIHPLSTSLQGIIGCDFPEYQEQCVLNVPFDGGDPTSPPKTDEEVHADRIMQPEENGCSPRFDYHAQEIDSTSNYDQCPPAKKLKFDKEYENEVLNGIEGGQLYDINKTIGIHDEKSNGKDDEQAKINVESHEQHISLNNGDRDHCRGEVDLTVKSTKLSSHCAVTQGSLAMTESQPNMCMKCNKDGQLLSCSVDTCTLVFHESCLGSSISFDDLGHFYCPFCAYSHAISEYVKAKEKVSLARKNLSLFIGGRPSDQPEQNGNTSSGDDVEDILKNADQTTAMKKSTISVTKDANPRPLELSRSSANLDANGLILAAQNHLSFKDSQRAEIIIHLSQGPSGIWNHARDYRGCDGAQLGDNEQIKNGSVIYADLKRKNESTRCKITEIHGEASESISESMSDSEGKGQDKRSSLPCPKPLREFSGSPRWRRKKVPWTAEEEAILKKGVETFVQVEGQVVPWKAILEYGASVFQPGRTPADLKDKWRNITGRGTRPKGK